MATAGFRVAVGTTSSLVRDTRMAVEADITAVAIIIALTVLMLVLVLADIAVVDMAVAATVVVMVFRPQLLILRCAHRMANIRCRRRRQHRIWRRWR